MLGADLHSAGESGGLVADRRFVPALAGQQVIEPTPGLVARAAAINEELERLNAGFVATELGAPFRGTDRLALGDAMERGRSPHRRPT